MDQQHSYSELSSSRRESKKENDFFSFSSSISLVNDDGYSKGLDTGSTDKEATFLQNYKYWNQETEFLSTNNFDNSYFKGIVGMGIDAVPFILKEIQKEPSQLVHALDLIFPGVVKYEGFVSLKEACEKWISILKETGIAS
ncbi:MAG: hypothetical protein LUC23_03815 [Prevotellaceae bacterium]|nr:hypothetical protein [Prevotellaceae bacterium]